MSSKGSERYREILMNKKRIYASQESTVAAGLEFINWLKEQPIGTQHKGKKFISTIKTGFVVRFIKNVNFGDNKPIMYDIIDIDGTLLFINENHLSKSKIKPFHGTFKSTDKFDDVIKVHLREKKLQRVLKMFEFEEE